MTATSAKTSLSDEAYEWLLGEIMSSRMRAGERYSEATITAALGISRTPIRSALQRLEQEGLVRRAGSSGFAIPLPTVREVHEACDLLALVDTYSLKRAAEKMAKPDSQRLVDVGRAMAVAAEEQDLERWSELDSEFHSMVHRNADNSLVTATSVQIRNRIQRFWLRAARNQYRLESCSAEHVALAEAVRDADLESIEEAVQTHIAHMRFSILHMLRGLGELLGNDVVDSHSPR